MKRDQYRFCAQRTSRLIGLVLLWGVMTPVAPTAIASPWIGDWVHFPIGSSPPSPLKLRKAQAQGIELGEEPIGFGEGLLRKPTGRGPFPAVIIVTGCAERDSFQPQWSDDLSGWGYVTLQIDSLGRHGSRERCQAYFGDLSFEALPRQVL